MACWIGSVEVEGVVIYAHGSATIRALASRALGRQIAAAVTGT